MYRIFYRDGTYRDSSEAVMTPSMSGSPAWAVMDLEITDGGDAYQALLRTLEVESS